MMGLTALRLNLNNEKFFGRVINKAIRSFLLNRFKIRLNVSSSYELPIVFSVKI